MNPIVPPTPDSQTDEKQDPQPTPAMPSNVTGPNPAPMPALPPAPAYVEWNDNPTTPMRPIEPVSVPSTDAPTSADVPSYMGVPPYGYDGMPPAVAYPRRPPRRSGRDALVALAILLSLLIGGGVGAAIASGRTSPSTGNTTIIGATSAPAVSVSGSTTSLQTDIENVAKAVEPSVVKITSTSDRQEAVGSGDILTANGYIVTNDHVVDGFTNFTVQLSNGSSYPATVVGQDAQDDLAVIKINATNLKPIAFGDSTKVTVGEFAVAVGNPLALQESATFGTVSGVNGTASEAPNGPAGTLTGLVQTTATIAPGNSGGALVNLQGQLIGIPTIEETNPDTGNASGIGYAIPASRVQFVAQQLIQNGQITSTGQGFIGIQARDVDPSIAAQYGLSVQSGVLVTGFVNDTAGSSPAQQAGLQTGDVIVAVDGHSVASSSDLTSILFSRAPGTKVTLTIVRGSSQTTVSVTLGERPTNLQG
jgi:S1-C subfamily serine protease